MAWACFPISKIGMPIPFQWGYVEDVEYSEKASEDEPAASFPAPPSWNTDMVLWVLGFSELLCVWWQF
jgi:hypothetical protein